jgi:serine phosphatase RsbU (regulator of sigma subunit)/Tfp pilus assembly protein PilF
MLVLIGSPFPKGFGQNQSVIDSLKQVIATSEHDTTYIKTLNRLSVEYSEISVDSSLIYAEQALKLSMDLSFKRGMITSYRNIGIAYDLQGAYEKAIEYHHKAFEIAEELNDKIELFNYYTNVGNIYKNRSSFSEALEYHLKALEIAEELDNNMGRAISYSNIGIVHHNLGSYDKAIEYYLKSVKIKEEQGDKNESAISYINIGIIYNEQLSYDKALEYFLNALKIFQEIGNKRGMAISYINGGDVLVQQGVYDKAQEYYQKSIEIFKELGETRGVSYCYIGLGSVSEKQSSYDEAIEYYMDALEIVEEMGDKSGMANIYESIASLYITIADSTALTGNQRLNYLNKAVDNGNKSFELANEIEANPDINNAANTLMKAYKKLGNYENAFEFAEIFISTQDSMFHEEKTKAIQDMATKYETEKKEQQIELQETELIAKDAVIKQQKTFRNALAAGLAAIVLIVVVIAIALRQNRRASRKIKDQNLQILEANEELKVLNEAISEQNNEIIDSINYAQRIQAAMLPPEPLLNELLDEMFILYKPRDIVSGDFYWIKQVNQYTIVAAADCTGHGVPGAFMSLLGISFLNEIVQRREITQANQVLNELRSQIKHSLRQHGLPDESKDGIDMALCAIDRKKNIMQYAGANNPLYIIKDRDGVPALNEIKADRMPLGYYSGKDKAFTNHEIKLEIGDSFYLFSDGFIDQKGGKDNRKFMSKNLKKVLLEIHDQPMFDQKKILERTLADWVGDIPQTDDILVLGVRV